MVEPLKEKDESIGFADEFSSEVIVVNAERLKALFVELKTKCAPENHPDHGMLQWMHVEKLFEPLVPK